MCQYCPDDELGSERFDDVALELWDSSEQPVIHFTLLTLSVASKYTSVHTEKKC